MNLRRWFVKAHENPRQIDLCSKSFWGCFIYFRPGRSYAERARRFQTSHSIFRVGAFL
jgi:hypothetical protein